MRQFIKFTFASCLGVFIALFIIGGIFTAMVATAGMKVAKKVENNSVLNIALDYTPPQVTNNVQSSPIGLNSGDVLGLKDIIDLIGRAKTDDNIKGIYLDPTRFQLDPVSGSEFTDAINDFKESSKFVLSYAEFLGQGNYYLASLADTIILNPVGSIDFRGFASFVPFYKEMFDKIGVKMDVYYAGKFKSATEPFRRTDMSDENKLQTRQYIEEVYAEFLEDIAQNRGIDAGELRSIANGLESGNAGDALSLGLVDIVGYKDAVRNWLTGKLGVDSYDDVNEIDIKDYYQSTKSDVSTASDRIAVVTMEGAIVPGEEEYGMISDKPFTDILMSLRDKRNIKAVVLRVNSPGGNILAAENILREVKLLQDAGKTVVVSMGDYAASGGYYISCSADTIFAASNTLTGSIGVFSLIPKPTELLNDKIGIRFDTVRTARHSASFSPFFEWSDEEHAFLKKRTDDFYTMFLEKVAEGRGMSIADVDSIAQGRIWTGQRALENGLVDAIGDLDDAVSAAASMAGLDEYRIVEYPRLKDPLQRLITEFSEQSAETSIEKFVDARLREDFPKYDAFKEMVSANGPVMRLPVIMEY